MAVSAINLWLSPWLQIADQVGELLIHCRYGCKPSQERPGEYEVDPSGECVCVCVCVCVH